MLRVPSHQRLGVRVDTQPLVQWRDNVQRPRYILFRLWTNGFRTFIAYNIKKQSVQNWIYEILLSNDARAVRTFLSLFLSHKGPILYLLFCFTFICTFLAKQWKKCFLVEFHHEHFVTQKRIFVLMHFQIFNIQMLKSHFMQLGQCGNS